MTHCSRNREPREGRDACALLLPAGSPLPSRAARAPEGPQQVLQLLPSSPETPQKSERGLRPHTSEPTLSQSDRTLWQQRRDTLCLGTLTVYTVSSIDLQDELGIFPSPHVVLTREPEWPRLPHPENRPPRGSKTRTSSEGSGFSGLRGPCRCTGVLLQDPHRRSCS